MPRCPRLLTVNVPPDRSSGAMVPEMALSLSRFMAGRAGRSRVSAHLERPEPAIREVYRTAKARCMSAWRTIRPSRYSALRSGLSASARIVQNVTRSLILTSANSGADPDLMRARSATSAVASADVFNVYCAVVDSESTHAAGVCRPQPGCRRGSSKSRSRTPDADRFRTPGRRDRCRRFLPV